MSFEIDGDGSLVWKNKKGQFHREKGPAVISPNGYISFMINNKFHRLNGPSAIYSDGSKSYWINGSLYTKEKYYTKIKKL